MQEFKLIEKYFKPLTKGCKAAQNLSDDVARIMPKKDHELIISKDVFVEDVHFLLTDGAFKIAAKLLRTNLSDLASSGATPLYYMLGFSKNKNTDEKFLKEFTRGLQSVQTEFNFDLIGGDTVRSEKLFFSITIFGSAKKNKILTRHQAKEGDLIFVSGTIGDAFLGLFAKQNNLPNSAYSAQLLKRHFFPEPRINLGKKLLEKKLSQCAIDVSDGLVADLTHICKASELSAEISLNKIPLSAAAQKFLQKNSEIKITDLICGGDDYELIFAVNPRNQQKIIQLSKLLNLDLSCIGHFTKSSKKEFNVTLRDAENHKITIKKTGYEH